MSDAGLGAAGRRARPSVRRRDGERLSRAERPGDPIPVEGELQADPDRAPTRTGVSPGEPPGCGGAAVRCRCQIARRVVGFGPPGTQRVAPGVPANSVAKASNTPPSGVYLAPCRSFISGVANDWLAAILGIRRSPTSGRCAPRAITHPTSALVTPRTPMR